MNPEDEIVPLEPVPPEPVGEVVEIPLDRMETEDGWIYVINTDLVPPVYEEQG